MYQMNIQTISYQLRFCHFLLSIQQCCFNSETLKQCQNNSIVFPLNWSNFAKTFKLFSSVKHPGSELETFHCVCNRSNEICGDGL